MSPTLDYDRLDAAVSLIGRTGATELQFGHLNDPVEDRDAFAERGPQWWAHARYSGTRITAEDHADPIEAIEALALRLLRAGRCAWCGNAVTLDGVPEDVVGVRLADGTTLGTCRWRRDGNRWDRGCTTTNRAVAATGRDEVLAAATDWTSKLNGATAIRRKPNRAERRGKKRKGKGR